MPKFPTLSNEVNEKLLQVVEQRVSEYLKEYFDSAEITVQDDITSFSYGTVNVFIQVKPWHFDDALVYVYSYLADGVKLDFDRAQTLLRMNATVPFGSFGVIFDNTVIFSYSLPGKNLDSEEFLAAVQTVATIADTYDEMVLEMK